MEKYFVLYRQCSFRTSAIWRWHCQRLDGKYSFSFVRMNVYQSCVIVEFAWIDKETITVLQQEGDEIETDVSQAWFTTKDDKSALQNKGILSLKI